MKSWKSKREEKRSRAVVLGKGKPLAASPAMLLLSLPDLRPQNRTESISAAGYFKYTRELK
jgi:hypothetical protein